MAIELTRENVEAAKTLLAHPVIAAIFDELERDAIEAAMNAKPLEHELRLALLNEVKTIRALRQNLLSLKARGANMADKGAAG